MINEINLCAIAILTSSIIGCAPYVSDEDYALQDGDNIGNTSLPEMRFNFHSCTNEEQRIIKTYAMKWAERCRPNLFQETYFDKIEITCALRSWISNQVSSDKYIGYYFPNENTGIRHGGTIYYSINVDYDNFIGMLTHEFGHALGLPHTSYKDDNLSIMTPTINVKANGIPSQKDIENLINLGWNCYGDNRSIPEVVFSTQEIYSCPAGDNK